MSASAIAAELNGQFGVIQDAYIAIFPPPPVQGLGTIGGFRMQVAGPRQPGLRGALHPGAERHRQERRTIRSWPACSPAIRSTCRRWMPTSTAKRPRPMAWRIDDIFDTMQVYLGSLYVNDFNRFGRTYQVNVQADQKFRLAPEQIGQLKVRNNRGEMVPLAHLRQRQGQPPAPTA
ncbi:MAG: efflux RND transporter permease subunit [Stutzerimonas stutzeri]